MRIEIVIAAAELHSRFRENRFVAVRLLERRLISRGPKLAAGRVAHIAKRAPGIAGGVFTPARNRQVFPAAVAATRVRNHHVISAVRQQLHFRHARVRVGKDPKGRIGRRRSGSQAGEFGCVGMECRGSGDALLQQQRGRLELQVRLESLLHRTIQQHISQRQETHALVMRHERADHGASLPARQTRLGVVYRLIESISSFTILLRESLQIQARLLRRDHQGHRGSVGRDHQVFRQSAFKAEAGYAECTVLIVEMNVDRVVPRLRNAPRNPRFFPYSIWRSTAAL